MSRNVVGSRWRRHQNQALFRYEDTVAKNSSGYMSGPKYNAESTADERANAIKETAHEWYRSRDYLFINGRSVHEIADETLSQLRRPPLQEQDDFDGILLETILRDVLFKDVNDREQRNCLVEAGLQRLCTSGLMTALNATIVAKVHSLKDQADDPEFIVKPLQRVDFTSTEEGCLIKESCLCNEFKIVETADIIKPNNPEGYFARAEATYSLAVNSSSTAGSKPVTVTCHKVVTETAKSKSPGADKIAALFDQRSLGRKLVDFLKNLFNPSRDTLSADSLPSRTCGR